MAGILLIIADETCRNLLTAALEQWGHTVETGNSYNDAVEKFSLTHKQFPYTMVITDDCLPETAGGTALDIQKGVQLVREILKVKKQYPIKRRRITLYPLYPEIILLSSLPGDTNPLSGYFHQGKKKKGTIQIYPVVTILPKGTDLKKTLEQKVKELEIVYWKRRYKISITGLILSAFLGTGIILKNSIYGFTPSSLIYILGIGLMFMVLYFFQVKPCHPSRVLVKLKKNERKV